MPAEQDLVFVALPFADVSAPSHMAPAKTTTAVLGGLIGQDRSYTVLAIAKQARSELDLATDAMDFKIKGRVQGGVFYVSLPLQEARESLQRLFPNQEVAELRLLRVETALDLIPGLTPTPQQTEGRMALWTQSELLNADSAVLGFVAPGQFNPAILTLVMVVAVTAVLNLVAGLGILSVKQEFGWFVVVVLVVAVAGIITTAYLCVAGLGTEVAVAGLVTCCVTSGCCIARLAKGPG
jgi:hypothetical protein